MFWHLIITFFFFFLLLTTASNNIPLKIYCEKYCEHDISFLIKKIILLKMKENKPVKIREP